MPVLRWGAAAVAANMAPPLAFTFSMAASSAPSSSLKKTVRRRRRSIVMPLRLRRSFSRFLPRELAYPLAVERVRVSRPRPLLDRRACRDLGVPEQALGEWHAAALGDGLLVDGPVAVAWGEDQVEEDYNDRLHQLAVLALRHAAVLHDPNSLVMELVCRFTARGRTHTRAMKAMACRFSVQRSASKCCSSVLMRCGLLECTRYRSAAWFDREKAWNKN